MKFLDRIRQLGQKVVNGGKYLGSKARRGIQWVKNLGSKARTFAGKIPVVGGLLTKTLDKLASTPIIFGYSARDIVKKAEDGVSGFDNLVGDAERLIQSKSVNEARRNAKSLYTKAKKSAGAIRKTVRR